MTTHRHRVKTEITAPYTGPIDGARPNPRAHGGVCHIAWCACGAQRRTNSTGFGRTERGPWVALDGDDETERQEADGEAYVREVARKDDF